MEIPKFSLKLTIPISKNFCNLFQKENNTLFYFFVEDFLVSIENSRNKLIKNYESSS